MSDFEGRVTEVLRSQSEAAPDAFGLADAARSRARARRRTRAAVVGAAAIIAVAVPIGVVALGGGDEPGRPGPSADNSDAADLPPIGRWESWHGVTVEVPAAWQYGDQATWCANGGSAETFRITRPGGFSAAIACTPSSSYGLAFQEIDQREPFDWPVVTQTGDAWPEGTFVGAHGENGVLVTVAGPDREQLLDVLATVRTLDDGVDPNGCGTTPAVGPTPPRAGMSVCRYDAERRLVQSEALVGADASAAAAALDHARAGELDCDPADSLGETILMQDTDRDVVIQLNAACTAVEGLTGIRIADADVLFWALSPGWTGDATGLPLPDQLRTYDPDA